MKKITLALISNGSTFLTVFLTFLLCNYSSAQTPDWIWARGAGESYGDMAYSIASDSMGNCYVTGYFSDSITFDTTTLICASFGGSPDVFVVKYDSSGNVLWAKSAGGTDFDFGKYAAIDRNGNCYVTGYFKSSSITFGSIILTNASTYFDVFLVKYDASGNVLWAKRAGGNYEDSGLGIAIDDSNNCYLTGTFNSDSITFGSTTLINGSATARADIFLVKYDSLGNVGWARSAGGTKDDYSTSVATDLGGNCYVGGTFNSDSITFGSTILIDDTSIGSGDIFIAKYDASGNVLWALGMGGNNPDWCNRIATSDGGSCYFTGYFRSNSITCGTTTLTNDTTDGTPDILVVKFDSAGNVLWAKKSNGGTRDDFGNSIVADARGNCYVTGYFRSTSITFGSTTLTNASTDFDIFVSKFDSSGNVIWAKSMGGNITDYGNGISLDGGGNCYVTGGFVSTTLPFGTDTLTNMGSWDVFVAKLGVAPNCSAQFSLFPDSVPHNWVAINQAIGVQPLAYTWSWGDGSPNDTGATPSHTYATAGYYTICLTITDSTGCNSTYCDSSTYLSITQISTMVTVHVVLPSPVGVNELIANSNLISIFPNPSTGAFTLLLPEDRAEILITDILGHEVRKLTSISRIQDFTLDANGVYLVHIQTRHGSAVRKLIVSR